jgi:hypothetical protein
MDTKDLSIKIEILREQMILVGVSKGLASPDTLRISETLDKLLNVQMELMEQKILVKN